MTSELEYAMVKREDGTPVPRTAALRSLALGLRALARSGGRVPIGPDGSPMLWSETRGWHPRDSKAGRTIQRRSLGRPIAELRGRQAFVNATIRQDRLNAEIAAERSLLRSASPLAWRWAAMFRTGTVAEPSLHASKHVRIGWALARRGYDAPPMWLRREQLEHMR
jgi:hypothetical protein